MIYPIIIRFYKLLGMHLINNYRLSQSSLKGFFHPFYKCKVLLKNKIIVLWFYIFTNIYNNNEIVAEKRLKIKGSEISLLFICAEFMD
jgi:hypothetical protein